MKKSILILYDYFDPAYKAGGPIRSLVNLVNLITNNYQIFILTSDRDHDGTPLSVKTDTWIRYTPSATIKYLSGGNRNYQNIKASISEIDPDVIYINGIFSFSFVVCPLLVAVKLKNVRTVIAPRGMLQEGALQLKAFKKGIYLFFLKILLKRVTNLYWHATDEQEALDIRKKFSDARVHIAGNIPVFDNHNALELNGIPSLQFVSISLITKKKNHIAFIKAIKNCGIKNKIVYHIYGPKSDPVCFEEIENEVKSLPQNLRIEYKGPIHPSEVSGILKKYKFYVLTSLGENFGHSIFEAFNNGIPVIISDQTPWKGLYEKKAGWDVYLNEPDALVNAIREAVNMDNETYPEFRKGARKMAEGYMRENDFVSQYRQLFDG